MKNKGREKKNTGKGPHRRKKAHTEGKRPTQKEKARKK